MLLGRSLWILLLTAVWLIPTKGAIVRQSPLQRHEFVEKVLYVTIEFKVELLDEPLAIFERIVVVGDAPELGSWRADDALQLQHNVGTNVWHGSVKLSAATESVNYRYFVASVDNVSGALQVRRWETYVQPRQIVVKAGSSNIVSNDVFGHIASTGRDVAQGWLHTGRILQFKLFRNPINIDDLRSDERLFVKLQPIDAKTLAFIQPSGRAYTEYARLRYGDSYLRAQPEYGVPYDIDDIVIFHTTLSSSDGTDVAYLLKVYAVVSGSDLTRLVGYQYVQSTELTANSEGKITVELISSSWPHIVGSVDLQYLKITALPNSSIYDLHTTFVDYWRANWTSLDVGHRGLGRSLKQTTNAPNIIENTVASMKASGALGADMVEFDVMLTSDLVPIIYHDYVVHKAKTSAKPTTSNDLEDVLIKDITYAELKNLKTYQVVGNSVVEYPAHNTVVNEDERLFPTFEDFLTKIDKSVGFDIEIKWPQLRRTGTYESEQTIDKNLYVDRILDVMQEHGCGRFSFFTSFDADICSLLRYKQNMYPVMFLSSTGGYADPRSDTVTDTINNAQAFDLAGIVPNAASIRLDSQLVQLANKQHKHVFLWGDLLSDTNSIQWFKDQKVTGVIYDRLDLWLPEGKQSAFSVEMDLPEFFQLQCPTVYVPPPNITFNFY